jgi:hypothetical protein
LAGLSALCGHRLFAAQELNRAGGALAPQEDRYNSTERKMPVPGTFVIKAEVTNQRATMFTFSAQKTMYGGKRIAKGDSIFIFASENEGGPGLIARGVVTSAKPIPKKAGIARQTPRVSIVVKRSATAKRRLGRAELKSFSEWDDGRPETELNFKFYRQATNKIIGVSVAAAAFLQRFF